MSHGKLRDGRITVSLAIADYRHEYRVSLCLIAALAAVQAPLLVLFGLRFGIISQLREDLHRNPTTLQLIPLAQGRHTQEFFAELRGQPQVQFLLPNTRAIPAIVRLGNPSVPSLAPVEADLIPTAAGDPLLANLASLVATREDTILSRTAADKLRVSAGDRIIARVSRTMGDQLQAVELPFTVRAVLPIERSSADAAFVAPELLLMTEDYREGFAVDAFSVTGAVRPPGERLFASFRLYAREIDDVAPLREWLIARGVDTDTRLSEIQLVRRLDRSLTTLFSIVAGLGAAGFGLSLAISLWGGVERKRYEIAVLRLLGLRSASLTLFPLTHAALTSVGGSFLATLLCAVAVPLINRLFAEGLLAGQVLCRLPLLAFVVAFLLTLSLALSAGAVAGWKASSLSPAEGLRHE